MTSPRRLLPPLVLAFLAACATPPGPRCPDKSVPRFSGNPFLPYLCPKDAGRPRSGSGTALLTTATQPVVDAASATSISPMIGNWEGWAMYGNARFQVTISVRQDQGITLLLAATEYIYHRVNKLEARLTGFPKRPGLYAAEVTDLNLAGSRLKAKAWLGAAPAPQSQGLDRSFVLAYNSLAALHEFRFKFDGPDKIWYVYTYRQPGQQPVQSSGSLTRTAREPF